jgi:hypothetical protein
MRRTILACAGVLLSVVALGSDSPRGYPDGMTQPEWSEGAWRMVGERRGGVYRPFTNGPVLTLQEGRYSYSNLAPGPSAAGVYRLNGDRLEMTQTNGTVPPTVRKYLWRREGDTIRVVPSDFRGARFDDAKDLSVYKRVK